MACLLSVISVQFLKSGSLFPTRMFVHVERLITRRMHANSDVPSTPMFVLNAAIFQKDVEDPFPFSIGTVCLRGADAPVLALAKRILLYLIQVRLSLDREISFYLNMGIASTDISFAKEPTLYTSKPRLLASSPNILFGK